MIHETLRIGSHGPAVKAWQYFLIGRGYDIGVADGWFGEKTAKGTLAFRRSEEGLEPGTVADQATIARAHLKYGYTGKANISVVGYPKPPPFPPLTSTLARQRIFGAFRYRSRPVEGNPENIDILDDWEVKNIITVEIPELLKIGKPVVSGRIRCHKLIASQLKGLWKAWDDAGLIDRVLTFDGSYAPRFVRGSKTVLSNHAFGTAFDINYAWNKLGVEPARYGQRGCVYELVPIAYEFGFGWGGYYRRRDGMHFQVDILK